jgi:hypothetical protein
MSILVNKSYVTNYATKENKLMTDRKQKCTSKDLIKYRMDKVEDCVAISNVNCPLADKQETAASRRCPPTELIKNGGFEQRGILEPFAYWNEVTSNFTIRSFEHPYEGIFTAEFISAQTPVLTEKFATLFQRVTVTPGCFLILSFADNFRRAAQGGFEGLNIRASVYYEDGGRVDLINVEIAYSAEADQAGMGFVFHQKMSDIPVPPNVNSVTVEFFVQVTDVGGGGNTTQWLLDGVSLRAI